jgi:RNA polymerase sigma-70 factor (ECF subfamily)
MEPDRGFQRVKKMGIKNVWPFRRDSHDQFERLLQPHLKQLYRLAYRFTGQRDDAEDLVQDLLLKLYPRMEEIESLDKPGPWLARVLYRQYIDRVRRQQRSPVLAMDDEEAVYETHASQEAQPAQVVETQIHNQMLQQALAQLNEDQRIAVMLHDVEGYSLQEIEQILDVSQGTLKSRLSRARAKLRDHLEKMEPDSQFARVSQ